MRYHSTPALNLIYGAGSGHGTGQELAQAEQSARHDPARQPAMRMLVDTQAVWILICTITGVPWRSTSCVLPAVVLREALDQRAAEIYALIAEPVVPLTMATCSSLAAALAWLGLAATPHRCGMRCPRGTVDHLEIAGIGYSIGIHPDRSGAQQRTLSAS